MLDNDMKKKMRVKLLLWKSQTFDNEKEFFFMSSDGKKCFSRRWRNNLEGVSVHSPHTLHWKA